MHHEAERELVRATHGFIFLDCHDFAINLVARLRLILLKSPPQFAIFALAKNNAKNPVNTAICVSIPHFIPSMKVLKTRKILWLFALKKLIKIVVFASGFYAMQMPSLENGDFRRIWLFGRIVT